MPSGFLVRDVQIKDASAIADIYAPFVENTVISFESVPPSQAEMQSRITEVTDRFPWLVAEINNEVVGYAYANAHRSRCAYQWCVEVSVYLSPRYQRQGIAKSLYEQLFSKLVQKGYLQAFAGISLPNEGSVAFHEAFGFSPIGIYKNVGYKMNRWVDVGWWQKQLGELPDVPEEIFD
jgi:L-amino acid N-acyltransferase YncA